jgi:hypothetical protein
MTDTDVALLPYYKPCPYDRHDLYLPSIPASLQTLGRFECAVTSAPAPHGLRIISPVTLTLVFSEPSGRLQKIGPEFFLPSVHRRFGLRPCAPTLVSSSSPSSPSSTHGIQACGGGSSISIKISASASASDWALGRAGRSAEAPRRRIARRGGTYLEGVFIGSFEGRALEPECFRVAGLR